MDFYDLVVCLLVALLAYRGLRRGLIGELVGLVVFACGMLLALRFAAVVGRRLVAIAPGLSATEGRVLAFFAIIVVVGVVLGLLGRRLSGLVSRIPVVGGLDRLGGLVLGAALALVCVWLVTAAVTVLPTGLVPFSATVRHSDTAPPAAQSGPRGRRSTAGPSRAARGRPPRRCDPTRVERRPISPERPRRSRSSGSWSAY